MEQLVAKPFLEIQRWFHIALLFHFFFFFLHPVEKQKLPPTPPKKYLEFTLFFFGRGNCHPGKDFPVVQLSLQLYFY